MSKVKEYITVDDLIEMLSDVKKEELELIRETSSLESLDKEILKFNGMLEVFMYQFHFLGIGTVNELKEMMNKITEEIENEVRKKIICQI